MQALTNRFSIALLGTCIKNGKALTNCVLFANRFIGCTCISPDFPMGLDQAIFQPGFALSIFNTRRVYGMLITHFMLL